MMLLGNAPQSVLFERFVHHQKHFFRVTQVICNAAQDLLDKICNFVFRPRKQHHQRLRNVFWLWGERNRVQLPKIPVFRVQWMIVSQGQQRGCASVFVCFTAFWRRMSYKQIQSNLSQLSFCSGFIYVDFTARRWLLHKSFVFHDSLTPLTARLQELQLREV